MRKGVLREHGGFFFRCILFGTDRHARHKKHDSAYHGENDNEEKKDRPSDSITAAQGAIGLACYTREHDEKKLENEFR